MKYVRTTISVPANLFARMKKAKKAGFNWSAIAADAFVKAIESGRHDRLTELEKRVQVLEWSVRHGAGES